MPGRAKTAEDKPEEEKGNEGVYQLKGLDRVSTLFSEVTTGQLLPRSVDARAEPVLQSSLDGVQCWQAACIMAHMLSGGRLAARQHRPPKVSWTFVLVPSVDRHSKGYGRHWLR